MSKLPGLLTAALLVGLLVAPARAQVEQLPPLSTIEPLPGSVVPPGPGEEYFDLDAFVSENAGPTCYCEDWQWQLLPSGIIYKAYLADQKESRIGTQVFSDYEQGWLWDTTLGGRAGVLRYGSTNDIWPQGWQLDIEGSGQVRLDPEEERDVQSADFRFGIPLTYGYGPHRLKFAYYHISAHAGDEFLEKNPGFVRQNWVRDAFSIGYSLYWTDNLRLYADTSWGFYTDISKPWDFRFGVEYAPARPTGLRGAPFFAINGHLMSELNYGGNFTVQAGWAWRGDKSSHLWRTGLHYHNGSSNQFEFWNRFEQQIGAGVWYDF
ncbi:MAG: DUF1207 domain-containing protein [Pirellulaceae bacterium]|nr:DUF1207 domain-containing protein [Pirellulaceae bacterium]